MDRPLPHGEYSTREVAKLLGLSLAQVRSCVKAAFVSPQAGPGGDLLFSFQDLVLLRTAKGLLEARVPRRRIRMALDGLQSQLPQGQPLTAVRISAQGHNVVARDRGEAWHPESGQTLLDFDVADLAQAATALTRRGAAAPPPSQAPASSQEKVRQESGPQSTEATAADWYEHAVALEEDQPQEAVDAYRRVLDLDPGLAAAHLNLGRLLHEGGDPAGAEKNYRQALAIRSDDALAAYNLGVALQDQRRPEEAVAAYERALAQDPALADAHFNLSGLYEELGDKTAAFRHLRTYHTLSGDGGHGGRGRHRS
jgi:tetratricopeptide (TPR) repeat protein